MCVCGAVCVVPANWLRPVCARPGGCVGGEFIYINI